MPDVPVLLPASSFARKGLKNPNLPPHISEAAADCGGFVATLKWGDYRYTPAEYVGWLETWAPSWAATFDYCCEPEIAANAAAIRERQEKTTAMAWHFWREYRDAPWAWVPTLQGWHAEDYVRHARELRPLVEEMHREYGWAPGLHRVGIGTLCRRASPLMVRRVVQAVERELPGVPLHLWGVKLTLLQSQVALPESVVSIDSAAWNGLFAGNRKAIKETRIGLGMSQREYSYLVKLPEYAQKVVAAQQGDKQGELAL